MLVITMAYEYDVGTAIFCFQKCWYGDERGSPRDFATATLVRRRTRESANQHTAIWSNDKDCILHVSKTNKSVNLNRSSQQRLQVPHDQVYYCMAFDVEIFASNVQSDVRVIACVPVPFVALVVQRMNAAGGTS